MDEGLDAVSLNLGLRVDAEFLADLDLDREAVRVPAGLPLAVLTPHRAVPRIQILDRPRQAMAGVGHAIGSRRPFEKHKPWSSSAAVERSFIRTVLTPPGGDRRFKGREVGLAADGFEHGAMVEWWGRGPEAIKS